MKTHLNALASGLARSAIAVALLAPAAAFAQEAPQHTFPKWHAV